MLRNESGADNCNCVSMARERRATAAPMTEGLIAAAVEDDRVARLIGDLRGQEEALALVRSGVQHRRQAVGDDLLAEEGQGRRRPQLC